MSAKMPTKTPEFEYVRASYTEADIRLFLAAGWLRPVPGETVNGCPVYEVTHTLPESIVRRMARPKH